MVNWVESVINSMSYWGIVLLMFLENVFPPIPSEVIMPLAGFTASRGELSFWGVVLAGTAGSVLGAIPLYYLGAAVGPARLCRWAGRHGHWLAVAPEDVRKARKWFERHGGKAVFLGRLVPGVRSLISVPAGVSRMPLLPFLLYTAVGSAIWSGLLALAGRLLAQNYRQVEKFLGPVTYVVIGGIVIAFVVRAVRIKRGQRQRQADPEGAC